MRALQYQLQLFDHGYVVVCGPIYDPDAFRGWEKCLPIKATITQCRDHAFQEIDFTDVILKDGDWGDEKTPTRKKFHENCRDIILGRDSDWYLYSFEVNGTGLVLDFYNPEEECTDYIIFDTTDGKVYDLSIQFDVPHHSGRPDTHYEVSLSGSYRQRCQ